MYFAILVTKVIEIFAADYLVKYYWIVSNVCGLEHYYLLEEKLEEKYPSEPAKKNIFVNLQKLYKWRDFIP